MSKPDIQAQAVLVGFTSSKCGNCFANFLGVTPCVNCKATLLYCAADDSIARTKEAVVYMKAFAAEHNLKYVKLDTIHY